MTDNKRKKNSRQRGSWTHGWGAKKKHRGAGHRGGRGKAGSGKRGDAKKTLYWTDPNYFGKRGFVSANTNKEVTINLAHLDAVVDTLIKKGHASKEKEAISINLTKLGYTKLLGAGKIKKKLLLTINKASESALQKVQAAGGKVTLLQTEEKQEKQE
ncbi:MAG: uL15 family ribosomal protein [Candidatus Nanoarchaeia archaeon]